MNLTSKVKDLYNQNFMTLKEKIEDTKKWKVSYAYG